MQDSPKIVVAGDVTIDWLSTSVAPVDPAEIGDQQPPNYKLYTGTRMVARPGGALLLAGLIQNATGTNVKTHVLENVSQIPPSEVIHSIVELDRYSYSARKNDGKKVYRVKDFRGFSGPVLETIQHLPVAQDDPSADIVVLDDAGNGYRDADSVWPSALQGKPIIIYKNNRPLAKGKLWDRVLECDPERLIVVVSANDLRSEPNGLNISRRLSWERTATDFVWQMACNAHLLTLANCANLVVRFGIDGAIHYTRREGESKARLYFDPALPEDGYCEDCPGEMLGLTAAFVAALTSHISAKGMDGIHDGIREGIQASRRLHRKGFGPAKEGSEPNYPGAEIFKPLEEGESRIADILIPAPKAAEPSDPDFWCIIQDDQRSSSLEEIACEIVHKGETEALQNVPIAQFGDLKTVDRAEIESFCSIKNLMIEYLGNEESTRPLCIAVFGPPGSGKSFGIVQVAQSISTKKVKKLEFNVAQFKSTQDLVNALHAVRDIALSPEVPLVFFDEFDATLEGELGWLKYFLAPMQDGKFKDGETMHPIGKAIFVFAGGTAKTLQEFAGEHLNEKPEKYAQFKEKFKSAKGPDFVSRLRGYVNILGPNPVEGKTDHFYIIRRAMLFRSLLRLSSARKYVFDGKGHAHIDEGVLRAFLKVPKFEHGARSMEAIIQMSLLKGRKSYEQAALPSGEQLKLHVNAGEFYRLVVRDILLAGAREMIAMAIHEKYRRDLKGQKPETDPSMQSWENLSETLKESNRQQADDIPGKLRSVQCGYAPFRGREPAEFRFTEEVEVEILAKLEHDRWVKERLLAGWTYGKNKDVDRKISPYLVPWENVPEDIREYDRNTVRGIPAFMADAKFEIYRLKKKNS